MKECEVDIKRNTPVFKDTNENICDEIKYFGLKCTHNIVHPEMCLVVDEAGANLSQKGDGHIGGQKYIC